jgi:hypothetical protein
VAGSECLLDGEKKGDRRDEGCCCFASCVMHQQKGKAAAWILVDGRLEGCACCAWLLCRRKDAAASEINHSSSLRGTGTNELDNFSGNELNNKVLT